MKRNAKIAVFSGILLLCIGMIHPLYAEKFRYPLNVEPVDVYYFLHSGGKDYQCIDRYDRTTHEGTDFSAVRGSDIVAAAQGSIIQTVDGYSDTCTTGNCPGGNGYGNHVRIRHTDGTITISAHMKNGSVAVSQNDPVICSQKIGEVASSGWSTGNHLHFEVRTASGVKVDPFTGPCSTTSVSYWVSQGAYRGSPSKTCDGVNPGSCACIGTDPTLSCTIVSGQSYSCTGRTSIRLVPNFQAMQGSTVTLRP